MKTNPIQRDMHQKTLSSNLPHDEYSISNGSGDVSLSLGAPLVSVIVPALNFPHYLEIAVRSVMAQSFENWEVIVVDDGSTEDLSFVTSLDERVRWLRQENRGTSAARNYGIAQARGEFVAFLDADDVWLPDKLALQLALFENDPDLGFCHTQFEMIDDHGKAGNVLLGAGYAQKGTSYGRLLEGCSVCVSTVLMRRQVCLQVGAFDETLQNSEDYDLWLRVSSRYRVGLVPSVQTQYRKHLNNASTRYWVLHAASSGILKRHRLALLRRRNFEASKAVRRGLQAIDATYGSQAFDQFRLALRRRDVRAILLHGIYALRYAPFYSLKTMLLHFLTSVVWMGIASSAHHIEYSMSLFL